MRRDIWVRRMRAHIGLQAAFSVQGLAVCVLAWTAGCSNDNTVSVSTDGPAVVWTTEAGQLVPEVPFVILVEPRTTDGGICPPLTCRAAACGDITDSCGQTASCGPCPDGGAACLTSCSAPGGDYCGAIGDGCGGQLNCPDTCPKPGWKCGTDNVCKGEPPFCTLVTCEPTAEDHYCGTIGNGCGDTLECGNDCPAGWACVDHLCVGSPPACTPLTCKTPSGDHYCGTIGNSCGGTLECGNDCPAGWTCENSVCVGAPPVCIPATCDTAGGGRYCGSVGNGCGGTLDCPAICPTAGWECKDNLCIGPPSVCTKIKCATDTGDHYCGTVGDNCGGSLKCGDDCPAGWTCGDDHICKGVPPYCNLLTCTASSGDRYCGTVGNGCGGTLECGDDCFTGWTCGTDHICKGGPGVCTQTTCGASSGDHYCGTIGDKCGGTLDCGLTCPKAGWVCDHNVCKGDPNCPALTTCAVVASGDNYCGAIGDGCGGTLDCGPTCPKAGWVCDTGLCKGPIGVCTPVACTTTSGDQYCGTIGDGCGHSVDCGTTCTKAGWTCQNGLCKGGSGCPPLACTTANGDQYCGVVGNGCGSSVDCGTACTRAGWTCQGGLCKGVAGVCPALTCKPAGGGQYCGTVGDGCGNALPCGTDCTASGANWVCGSNNVCVGGAGCLKVACNNTDGFQQYCGTIGDNCGGTLSCPSTCPTGTTCGTPSAHICGCGNLCLKQVRCDGTATTSISGTVYDPAGLNPLYNVIVSIPNGPLDPISTGAATCPTCDSQVSGQPIATALTDAKGHFVLNNVPWGTDFPLVMQLGKWRRQVTITAAMVTHQCADNPIPDTWTSTTPATLLRLPKNIHDGDNNGQYTSMPKIAITTGTIDALECLLTRIGIDTAEFTNPAGTGHINLYSLFSSTDTNRT